MTPDEMETLVQSPWKVDSFRLSVFVESPQAERSGFVTWWDACIGEAPNFFQMDFERGFLEYRGRFKGNRAKFTINGERQDWVVEPESPWHPENAGKEYSEKIDLWPEVTGFPPLADAFCGGFYTWLEKFVPPLNRLALGMTLYKPVPSGEDGYLFLNRFLQNTLKTPLDPKRDFDFQFSLNRRVEIPLLLKPKEINRFVEVCVENRFFEARAEGKDPQSDSGYAVRLLTDFSTQPDTQFENPSVFRQVMETLVGQTAKIAMEGDVAWR